MGIQHGDILVNVFEIALDGTDEDVITAFFGLRQKAVKHFCKKGVSNRGDQSDDTSAFAGAQASGLHVDLIPHAVDGLQHPSTVFFFNGVKVVQNSGNGGRGNACASCNFLYRCHGFPPE